MREIEFRGKRIDNGEWEYGYLYQIWEQTYILWGMTNGVPNMAEVIPKTVGQYAGWQDTNNKSIYEGDVIKTRWVTASHKEIDAVVYWADGAFWLDGKEEGGCEAIGLLSNVLKMDDGEIIGNIHEGVE